MVWTCGRTEQQGVVTHSRKKRRSVHLWTRHQTPERKRNWTLFILICWGQYIRSHTSVPDMQSGSLTATLDILLGTQCGHRWGHWEYGTLHCGYGITWSLRLRRAQEFKSRGLNEVRRKNDIRQEYPAPYTQQDNGIIGRLWDLHARDGGSTKATLALFFGYIYVKNRFFYSGHNSTPGESEMQPFGCRAFVLTKDRKKLDGKAQTGIFLGYTSKSKCFIVCTEYGTPERKPQEVDIKERGVQHGLLPRNRYICRHRHD